MRFPIKKILFFGLLGLGGLFAISIGAEWLLWQYLVISSRHTYVFHYDNGRIVEGKDNVYSANIIKFISTSPTGHMQVFADKTKIEDYHLVNGKKQGKHLIWTDKVWLRSSGFYTNGIKTGVHQAWWTPSNPMYTEYYIDGALHGTVTNWHKQGGISQVCSYSNGVIHGENSYHSPSGRLIAHGYYSNGMITNGEEVVSIQSNQGAWIIVYTNGVAARKYQDWERWKE